MENTVKSVRLAVLEFRQERARLRLEALRKVESRFPWYRLAVLIFTLLVIFLAFELLPLALAWFAAVLAVGGFAVIAAQHQKVIDRVQLVQAFERLLTEHIARQKLDWPGIPAAGEIPVTPTHPFAADLIVAGARSLHQLLDTTVSQGGSQRLAGWLLNEVPDPAQIEARQRIIRELIDRSSFRLRLELNGKLAVISQTGRWDDAPLLTWLDTHKPVSTLRSRLILLSFLALANIALFILNAIGVLPPLWLGTFVIYFFIQASRYRETSEVFDEAYSLAKQLGQIRKVLTGLETYAYTPGTLLTQAAEPLCDLHQCPSVALRQINQIVTAASLRNNPFLSLLLNILGPWDLFFAYQLERYKRRLSDLLPAWLNTWYELEALTALANYTFLNPQNTFPVIMPLTHQPVFSAKNIGHPLIPDSARVSNDFSIQQLGEVTIITGSNMSGKSTFLRTIGANLVLAYAGSSVPAYRLQIIPFRLFTSMNVTDSLSDGISFFYAEVRRLKALLENLESPPAPRDLPLFFLIDEIFRGTNNRERQLGSHAYTTALTGRNGAGLISTHDLELAHLAETIPLVRNQHFREEVADGKMIFDYKIRPGASPTTNALKIMSIAGLPVPDDVKNT